MDENTRRIQQLNMCLYSQLIPNPKYKPNKKNGGIIPAVYDERVKAVAIGCSNCIECRNAKKREWQVRLLEEIKTTRNGKFVTLTFNNETIKRLLPEIPEYKLLNEETGECRQITPYERENMMATKAVRLFTELWRKHHKKTIRHWLITELGHENTEHIHLHGILWTDANYKTIRERWKHGYIYPRNEQEEKDNYVNEKTINYCIKYVSKMDVLHKTYKPIILASNGIGRGYTKRPQAINNKFNGEQTREYYKTSTGHKIALPIYYRNQLYNDEEREKLWINKLDKNVRYIRGEKINIKNNEEEYYKLLKWHQNINTLLGYGNGTKDWNRTTYEHQRRILIQQHRIKS